MGIKPYVVPVKVHSCILTFTLFGSSLLLRRPMLVFDLASFFSFSFVRFFFFSFLYLLSFLFFAYQYFSLALTFAWVALPGFRPSEPLEG